MSEDIMRKITLVRRRTRDPYVLDLLEVLEKTVTTKTAENFAQVGKAKFDKTAYMKDYMRKRRAGQKNGK